MFTCFFTSVTKFGGHKRITLTFHSVQMSCKHNSSFYAILRRIILVETISTEIINSEGQGVLL